MSKHHLRALVLALACLAAIVIAGCGGSESDSTSETTTEIDPATLVPDSAPIYAETVLKPSGTQGDDLQAALDHFPGGGDLGGKLVELLDKGLAESDTLKKDADPTTYAGDFEPWLGNRLGIYVDEIGPSPQVGVVITITDKGKLEDTLSRIKDTSTSDLKTSDYGGFTINTNQSISSDSSVQFNSYSVLDDALIVGTDDAVKAMIDVNNGDADPLSGSEDLNADRDKISGQDSLAFVYLDTKSLISTLKTFLAAADLTGSGLSLNGVDPQQLTQVYEQVFASSGVDLERPFALALSADADAVKFTTLNGIKAGASTQHSALLEDLPAGSWLAVAYANYGQQVDQAFTYGLTLGANGTGLTPAQIQQQVQKQAGFDVLGVFKSIGDIAFYARGEKLSDLEIGAVLQVTDPKPVLKLLGFLKKAVEAPGIKVSPLPPALGPGVSGFRIESPQLPQPAAVIYSEGKLAAGLGEGAIQEVFHGGGGTDNIDAASKVLSDGVDPSLIVQFPAVLSLIENIGSTSASFDQAGFDQAKPYLEALGTMAAGSGDDGSDRISEFSIGLQG